MRVRLVEDLGTIDAAAWDALAGDDDPFVEHGFLHALERSGTVGPGSGWEPLHVTVWEGDRLVGAHPLYVKEHSFGEYIFDWSWADAASRLGIPYYPKLVSMVPVTPVTGTRLLVDPAADRPRVIGAMVDGLFEAAEKARASSIHVLFLGQHEIEVLAPHARLRPRLTHQFHWHNDGYGTFDDFVERFRSSMRKQVRRERRRVAEAGLDIRVVEGPDLTERDWSALHRFYRDTCAKRGSFPYLTHELFELLRDRLAHRVVAALAYRGGRPIAGSLNFEKGQVLYGRCWGCTEEHDGLHFELCYYRLIERAIERGLSRFEAGAQGSHKLRRGLMPVAIHSAHWIRHPVLAAAVADYLPREADATRRQLAELADHGPFRRDPERGAPDKPSARLRVLGY